MSKLDQAVAALRNSTPILMHVSKLSEDMKSPGWNYLLEEYQTAREPLARVLVTILNAIVTQQRVYFAITRDMVRQMVQADQNWSERPGFGNDQWRIILRLLADTQIANVVHKGKGARPSVYRLGERWLYLIETSVNHQSQEAATISFVERSTEGLPDQFADDSSDLKGKGKSTNEKR